MNRFSPSPFEAVSSLWHRRGLVRTMVRREVLGRYRGSLLGLAWSFFNPLLMLGVYTFVFSTIFKSRWADPAQEQASQVPAALILFAGLIVNGFFSEVLGRASTLIVGNVNYVKKVVFPLELLPVVAVGSALVHACISLVVLLAACLVLGVGVPWTAVFLPFILMPLIVLVLGLAWILAALGVFLRDVSQLIGVVLAMLLFLSPIFYPSSAVPAFARDFMMFNPLTLIVEQVRAVLIWRQLPDVPALCAYLGVSVAVACGGFAWFQLTRKGFADVL